MAGCQQAGVAAAVIAGTQAARDGGSPTFWAFEVKEEAVHMPRAPTNVLGVGG